MSLYELRSPSLKDKIREEAEKVEAAAMATEKVEADAAKEKSKIKGRRLNK